MNRWLLTDEVKDKFYSKIYDHIKKLESYTSEQLESLDNEEVELDLTNTGLNPSTLLDIMILHGYDKQDSDHNGWEMDFYINISGRVGFGKTHIARNMVIHGTGMTFELLLTPEGWL